MADSSGLYRAVGHKIRTARERLEPKVSQAKLAQRLGISRVSVVNIEAGRQHAPLSVLWRIAEILETELVLLLPRRGELQAPPSPMHLDQKTLDQIKQAVGDRQNQQKLTGAITKLKTTLETQPPPLKEQDRHDKPISRSAR